MAVVRIEGLVDIQAEFFFFKRNDNVAVSDHGPFFSLRSEDGDLFGMFVPEKTCTKNISYVGRKPFDAFIVNGRIFVERRIGVMTEK